MQRKEWTVDPQSWVEVPVPAFATADEAIARHRLLADGTIVTVEMKPEYGGVTGIWHRGDGEIGLDGEVPDELRIRLMMWHTYWTDRFDPITGWVAGSHAAWWLAEGRRLHGLLQEQLWWRFEILDRFDPASTA
ncbi:hypothetical protein [Microbacterium sp. GXS0129]|uniref:hypothetical protein n=1 Tax=Microbacterium sp. GXS0129 TaxID=3377836 RepID=UPI00383B5C71